MLNANALMLTEIALICVIISTALIKPAHALSSLSPVNFMTRLREIKRHQPVYRLTDPLKPLQCTRKISRRHTMTPAGLHAVISHYQIIPQRINNLLTVYRAISQPVTRTDIPAPDRTSVSPEGCQQDTDIAPSSLIHSMHTNNMQGMKPFHFRFNRIPVSPLRQRHKYYHGVFYLKIYIARSFYLQNNKTPELNNTKKNTIRIYDWNIIHMQNKRSLQSS